MIESNEVSKYLHEDLDDRIAMFNNYPGTMTRYPRSTWNIFNEKYQRPIKCDTLQYRILTKEFILSYLSHNRGMYAASASLLYFDD